MQYERSAEVEKVAKLYGAWNDDLGLFLQTAKTHPLFEDIDNQNFESVIEEPEAEETKEPIKVVRAGNGAAPEPDLPAEAPKTSDLPPIKEHVAKRQQRATAP